VTLLARRDIVLALVLFLIACWQNLSDLRLTPFHADETRWLNRAHYVEDILDPFGPTWDDQYLTRGQPPMGSYLMGLGLLLQGRDLETNGVWDFGRSTEWNIAQGNMASQADLDAGRRTNAVVGALAVVALYALARRLTNRVGGFVAALFLAAHPLMIYLSSQAVSDALMALFVILAALAAARLADQPTWPRAILLGLFLGLGGATKLSPILISLPLAALGAALLVWTWSRGRGDRSLWRASPGEAGVAPKVAPGGEPRVASRVAARGAPRVENPGLSLGSPSRAENGARWSRLTPASLLLSTQHSALALRLLPLPLIAFAVFVAVYPYLWRDPIGHTLNLIEFRADEMALQARNWPNVAVESRAEALRRVGVTLGTRFSTTGRLASKLAHGFGRDWHPAGVDLPLAIAGGEILIVLALWRGLASRWTLAGLVLGTQAALIVAGMRSDWARYHLPVLMVAAVCIGVLAGQLWALLNRRTVHTRLRAALYAGIDRLLSGK
jgi:hypothetical protein